LREPYGAGETLQREQLRMLEGLLRAPQAAAEAGEQPLEQS